MPLARSKFLAFVECAGCGESFPVRSEFAFRRAKWCSERCRKAQYAGTCADCGAPTDGSNGRGPNAAVRCASCDTTRFVARNAERHRQHRELVERLWAEGLTAREIAARLGWTSANPGCEISTLRKRGYNLPYRYSAERIARMTRGADERLAKARAAQKAAA